MGCHIQSDERLTDHATESKKSNVVLSADLTTTKDLLEIADGKKPPVPPVWPSTDLLSTFSIGTAHSRSENPHRYRGGFQLCDGRWLKSSFEEA